MGLFEIMPKSYIKYLGLDKEWTRDNVLDFIIKHTNSLPHWDRDYGLVFKPKIFPKQSRKKVQEILQITTKEEAKLLRNEIKRLRR